MDGNEHTNRSVVGVAVAALLVIVLGAGLSSCSSSAPTVSPDATVTPSGEGSAGTSRTASTPAGAAALTLAADQPLAGQAAATEAVLRARLDALGQEGALIAIEGATITVKGLAPERLDDARRLLVAPGVLTGRPVMESLGAVPAPPITGSSDPALEAVLAEEATALSPSVSFRLGPVAFTGVAIDHTNAVKGSGEQWLVDLIFREGPSGIDLFNAAAGHCFQHDSQCPTGQFALIIDDRVITAPNIVIEKFAADQIQINGRFSEASAKELSGLLNAKPLPTRLHLA
jgi:preprotein translocase subunit SecD